MILSRPAPARRRLGHAAAVVAAVTLLAAPAHLAAQDPTPRDTQPAARDTTRATPPARSKAWYERLSLRGYTQVRYNRLLETNPDLTCAQCDKSIGRDNGFLIRRARLVLSGDVHPRVSVYIQPDLATEAGGTLHFAQLRDAYFDVFLDEAKTLRLRVGQSKIPFGFQNLQSSSNRLPLDRDDGLNSGLPNERDLGVIGYWSPPAARQRFKILSDSGLKGSGDYGVVGLGLYNGQTANRAEQNDGQHAVLRVSYPFRLPGGQFIEAGVQGYSGRFVIPSSQRTTGLSAPSEFDDRRVAASLIVYPQPIGFQAEWNVGRSPAFSRDGTPTIRDGRLTGGYAMVMARTRPAGQVLIPFARGQYYDGGKKLETDARHHRVRELEVGAEWLPFPAIELTATYVAADRRTSDFAAPDAREKGRFLRLQAQFNY
ncbi:MAG: porin [Gemmatirosa sp.]